MLFLFFLREDISGAGAVRGDEGPPLRAHSIRGVSPSAAFLQNWSVSKVLEAATWKSNSVFASFYFRDKKHCGSTVILCSTTAG